MIFRPGFGVARPAPSGAAAARLRRRAALIAYAVRDGLDEDLADVLRVADLVGRAAGHAGDRLQGGKVTLVAEHDDDDLDLLRRVVELTELPDEGAERDVATGAIDPGGQDQNGVGVIRSVSAGHTVVGGQDRLVQRQVSRAGRQRFDDLLQLLAPGEQANVGWLRSDGDEL